MYESFYGLRERPFDLTPNPRFLFLTARQREAYSHLQYGLTTRRGLTLLIGEAGTGKTTLVQSVMEGLEGENVACVLMSNPTLTRTEFYEFLADAFGLTPTAAASKTRFLFELRQLLLERFDAGELTAVVLDEAQSLPDDLLEEVRLLSNIETPTEKLLNVVLAGQPELAERLNQSGLRQLKQRISLRCELAPLDLRDTAAYVAGRLRIAGGKPANIFSREAIVAIYEASRGVPRTINVICDNALISGFAAEVRPVSSAIVEEITRNFDLPGSERAAEPRRAIESNVKHIEFAEPAPAPPAAVQRHLEPEPPMFGIFTRKRRYSMF